MFKYLLFLSLFVGSFSLHAQYTPNKEGLKIITNFSGAMVSEGFMPVGISGNLENSIQSFKLEYKKITKTVSLEEARKIIVEKTEKLICLTNNKSAKRYLKNSPFDENKIMLVLYFAGSDYGVHDNGEITLVYQDEGFVSYLGHNQEGFYSLYEESYAEAYQKLYGTSIPIRKF